VSLASAHQGLGRHVAQSYVCYDVDIFSSVSFPTDTEDNITFSRVTFLFQVRSLPGGHGKE